VIDFKYSKKKSKFKMSARTTVLERFKDKGILHPAAQLIIYRHFIRGVDGALFYFLKETSQDRVMALPEEAGARAEDLMSAIKDRLDAITGGNELAPKYGSSECEYCLFQSLCGQEGYYKASRGNN